MKNGYLLVSCIWLDWEVRFVLTKYVELADTMSQSMLSMYGQIFLHTWCTRTKTKLRPYLNEYFIKRELLFLANKVIHIVTNKSKNELASFSPS